MAAKNDKTKAAGGPACPTGLNLPRPTREDYVATVLEQVGAFEEKLDEIEADMENSGWNDIGDYRGQLEDLRARLKGIRARSGELEGIPDQDWSDAYEEMEASLLDAAGSLEQLSAGLSTVLPE
jgi:hypothetical protein